MGVIRAAIHLEIHSMSLGISAVFYDKVCLFCNLIENFSQNEQEVVISCSGNFGDEEILLKWTRNSRQVYIDFNFNKKKLFELKF